MSPKRLSLSSWHLWEGYLESSGCLLLQSFKTISASHWRGSVFLASSHSPSLPWCPFTKTVFCAFLTLNGRRGGTLEPVLKRSWIAGLIGVPLSLLTSVHRDTAEGALGPPCFQVMLLAPVLASAYQDLWGFFSVELLLGWAVPTVQHRGLFLPVQKIIVLLNSIRFLSACSPACPGPAEQQPCLVYVDWSPSLSANLMQ